MVSAPFGNQPFLSCNSERRLWVVCTQWRLAASGNRNFTDRLSAMNSKRGLAHRAPKPTYVFRAATSATASKQTLGMAYTECSQNKFLLRSERRKFR